MGVQSLYSKEESVGVPNLRLERNLWVSRICAESEDGWGAKCVILPRLLFYLGTLMIEKEARQFGGPIITRRC